MMEEYERGFEPDMVCEMADEKLALKVFMQPPQIIRSPLLLKTGGATYYINLDPEAWLS
jgi:hypothetical protein